MFSLFFFFFFSFSLFLSLSVFFTSFLLSFSPSIDSYKRNYLVLCKQWRLRMTTIPFLDTLVIKDSQGRLTTSVYRKPTHTDQYLSCDLHHPQSVKRGVVKCLYDRSKNITTKPSATSEEKKHLTTVLYLTDTHIRL